MRVAALGLHHESNSFAPVPASLDRWLAAGPVEGEAVIEKYGESQATMAGFIESANADPDVELVPLVAFDLQPMGAITAEAFNTMTGRMVELLDAHGPWDAVLLVLHGAAVSEEYRDADREILRRVRTQVGPDVAIGVTLDMHANIAAEMLDDVTVLNTYMTNPHLDPRRRARVVGDLTFAAARGEINPTMALETPPLAINILRQGTDDEPMKQLVEHAAEVEARSDILCTGIAEGFPYADVEEMGMSFLAVTDGDPELARRTARELAERAWAVRSQLDGGGADVDQALLDAAASTDRPIVLLDVGDNVGGGSPADSTHVLAAAQRLGVGGLFHSLCDPEAASACIDAGVGATVSLNVGAKADDLHGAPVAITGEVVHTDDGRFEDSGPTHGGYRFYNCGPRAVVRTTDDHLIFLTSRPMGNTSREELASAGFDPLAQPIIVAKGVHSPRATYEPIAARMVQLNTPGCTSADLSTLTYEHRREPMFPWEPEATYP